MTQMNEGKRAFEAGLGSGSANAFPLEAFKRVTMDTSDGTVGPADHNDEEVGITDHPAQAEGDHVTVRLRNFPGSRKLHCKSVCAIGDALYAGSNGDVDTAASPGTGTAGGTISTTAGWTALEACATAGGLVEGLPV